MFEVLEHVDQPVAMINRATDLLEPGGVLYLTTPNYNSLDRLGLGSRWDVFHPEHITYFSTRGLAQLIRRRDSRLRLVSVESNNVSSQLIGRVFELMNGLLGHSRLKDCHLNSEVSCSPLDLRSLSEGTRLTRAAKRCINQALSALGMGSTTIITAKKLKS